MDENHLAEATVVVRVYDPLCDAACVYSTWRNSSYYLAADPFAGKPGAFFSKQTAHIKKVLKSATVRIACLEDAPTVIVGYSVSTGKHLDWVYVKPDYRGKGIGRLLVPLAVETVTGQLTKAGRAIVLKKNLTIKENENESR